MPNRRGMPPMQRQTPVPLINQSIEIKVTMQDGVSQTPICTTVTSGNTVQIWGVGGATRLETIASQILAANVKQKPANPDPLWCSDQDIAESVQIAARLLKAVKQELTKDQNEAA